MKAIEEIARSFAEDAHIGGEVGDAIWALSYRAAEHQLSLHRVRDARKQAWSAARARNRIDEGAGPSGDGQATDETGNRPLSQFNAQSPKPMPLPGSNDAGAGDQEDAVRAAKVTIDHLARLLRYERRATRSRDLALQELDEAKLNVGPAE